MSEVHYSSEISANGENQYLEESRDFNHHNSASLEVSDNGPVVNPTEDEMHAVHATYGHLEGEQVHRNMAPTYGYIHEGYNQYAQHPGMLQDPRMVQQHQLMQTYHPQHFHELPNRGMYEQHMPVNQMIAAQHPAMQSMYQQQPVPQVQNRVHPSAEETQAPAAAARKKTKSMYPWLDVSGPACLSERQESRLSELTNVSKKYKNMKCTYCAKYNPITPWASMRPRKYELSSLQDHANSAHHKKSERLMEEANGRTSPVRVSNVVYHVPEEAALVDTGAPPEVAAVSALSLPTPTATAVVSSTAVQASAALAGLNKTAGKNKRKLQELTKTHATRGPLRPSWLHTEGGLIFSERQMNDPDRPAGLVKKYQNMMCTLCATHSPRSPWAVLKPRKFEARLLAEHELSTHHIKSSNAAAYNPVPANGVHVHQATQQPPPPPQPQQPPVHTQQGSAAQMGAQDPRYAQQSGVQQQQHPMHQHNGGPGHMAGPPSQQQPPHTQPPQPGIQGMQGMHQQAYQPHRQVIPDPQQHAQMHHMQRPPQHLAHPQMQMHGAPHPAYQHHQMQGPDPRLQHVQQGGYQQHQLDQRSAAYAVQGHGPDMGGSYGAHAQHYQHPGYQQHYQPYPLPHPQQHQQQHQQVHQQPQHMYQGGGYAYAPQHMHSAMPVGADGGYGVPLHMYGPPPHEEVQHALEQNQLEQQQQQQLYGPAPVEEEEEEEDDDDDEEEQDVVSEEEEGGAGDGQGENRVD